MPSQSLMFMMMMFKYPRHHAITILDVYDDDVQISASPCHHNP